MPWLNARPPGSEVLREDEEYTVGEHEPALVLPRGLALEDGSYPVAAEYWDGDSWEPLTEVGGEMGDPLGSTEFRVLYDPDQPLGGAWEFGAADETDVRISYEDRGSLVWAHDAQRAEITISDTPPSAPVPGQKWWDSTDGQEYIWYDDAWVGVY